MYDSSEHKKVMLSAFRKKRDLVIEESRIAGECESLRSRAHALEVQIGFSDDRELDRLRDEFYRANDKLCRQITALYFTRGEIRALDVEIEREAALAAISSPSS